MKIVASNDFGPVGFKWLTLKRITWTGPDGRPRFWEAVERTTRATCGVDGVAIVARIISDSNPTKIIIERQYRPPLENFCLELPAGLIDEGEDAGTAAIRELLEETGYTGKLIKITPISHCDPGITNANMQVALVDVDADASENASVQQNIHDGEFIEIDTAPWGVCGEALYPWLLAQMKERQCEVDARLLSFALGLQQSALSSGSISGSAANNAGMEFKAHRSLATSLRDDDDAPFGSPLARSEANELAESASFTNMSTSRSSTWSQSRQDQEVYNNNTSTDGNTMNKMNGHNNSNSSGYIGSKSSANDGSQVNNKEILQLVQEVVFDKKYLAGFATAVVIGLAVASLKRHV